MLGSWLPGSWLLGSWLLGSGLLCIWLLGSWLPGSWLPGSWLLGDDGVRAALRRRVAVWWALGPFGPRSPQNRIA